ncbi:glutamine amidotransferase, putative [Bodo saltans]|uniref:Glutamine amidotransferase, putative n=1 Tax=Bodo saltans TaxID=75058 RepID=A0A0S4IIM8_BODSA|nr:glutamine amidotransferase, putative [Bodo saltans]|eukprot:CUE72430.1 glutamine amidotransferase, putative [Bodo saltans]
MSQDSTRLPRRVLGVICGPPRAGLTPWSELIVETVRKHKHILPNGVNEEAWAQLEWEFVSLYDNGDAILPDPETLRANFAAVIFSGSKLNTTEQIPWLDGAMSWIRTVIGPAATDGGATSSSVPLMGICFGHQLIAKSLGGVVDFNPRGVELGTAPSTLNHANAVGDPLWRRVFGSDAAETETKSILMQELHWQSVLALPKNGAVSFAGSSMCDHQWVRYCTGVYGTQFHPEYPVEYMSELGKFLPWQKVGDGDEQAGEARKQAYYSGLTQASPQGCSIAAAFVDLAITAEPQQ